MDTRRLRARVARAEPVGPAHISGWQLVFDKPGGDGTGKANLVQTPGAIAWGVLFEIDEDAWSTLDRFEPGYARCSFRFERRSGASLEAHAYLYPAPDSKPGAHQPGPPTREYLRHIIDGAQEHGLPEDYIEKLRTFGA